MKNPKDFVIEDVTLKGKIDSPSDSAVRYVDHYIEDPDEGVIPAFMRAQADMQTALAFMPNGVYAARPSETHGGIWYWDNLQVAGNGARIVVEPTPYLVDKEGRQRYQLISSKASTKNITVQDLTIEYERSDVWRNLTLDGIHLEGEFHTLQDVTVTRPRAGATRECFPLRIAGPGAYPNPTNRMVRCKAMWPQENLDDERATAYIPEFTPFFVGGGEIIDCQAWLVSDEKQVAPCQGASGRGRALRIIGNRVFVYGDTRRCRATWIQLPEGSGLPDATISDNQVVRMY